MSGPLLSSTMSKEDLENTGEAPPPAGSAESPPASDVPAPPITKKKKRSKKKSAQKQTSAAGSVSTVASSPSGGKNSQSKDGANGESAVSKPIRIARNKHWRYVSSFHVRFLIIFLYFTFLPGLSMRSLT